MQSIDLHALDSKKTIYFFYGACEKDFCTAPLKYILKIHNNHYKHKKGSQYTSPS